ncbi:MAG: NADP-specific glutamate dehydrogenase [Phycisphaerales bacterium JB059]
MTKRSEGRGDATLPRPHLTLGSRTMGASAKGRIEQEISDVGAGDLLGAAISEVGASIEGMEGIDAFLDAGVLRRLLRPDRVIRFRVDWVDDEGEVRVNTGWRVEHCNLLGPYKGGLRFHRSVNEDTLAFLAFEQCFKNALTGLPLGGGKGGSDFDPRGKTDEEVMRFCQAFMRELHRHIGAEIDVPAGDIGVGAREIGFLYGQWLRITRRPGGVLSGKPQGVGGIPGRTEATGYGLIEFADQMLREAGDAMEDSRIAISGAGNVALHAAERAIQRGAKVVTLSDSDGTILCEGGLSERQIGEIKALKEERRGRLSEFESDGVTYHEGSTPWGLTDATLALPCATQHELDVDGASALMEHGLRFIAEGANMPCTHAARDAFVREGVRFGPGKASNAGGVACSGFEMSQNATRTSWTREKTIDRVEETMRTIHATCLEHAPTSDGAPNYAVGADRAGFQKLAAAMVALGV